MIFSSFFGWGQGSSSSELPAEVLYCFIHVITAGIVSGEANGGGGAILVDVGLS